MKRYLSELIGTFSLVFAGTGAIIVNDFSSGAVTHVGISITFGLIVMSMIYATGDISGAHINPAVSVGFFAAGIISGKETLIYIIFQLMGALLGSSILKVCFPSHSNLGATFPPIDTAPAFVFEVLLTFILMLVIFHVATGAKDKGLMAGVAIGATVCLEAMFARDRKLLFVKESMKKAVRYPGYLELVG
jgi:aquaporin Z